MESKIIIPESFCRDELVDYIASRYSITPEQVISHFLSQEGIIVHSDSDNRNVYFKENEMAILRDLGIRPSQIEYVDTI